jgi:hypothetical protein
MERAPESSKRGRASTRFFSQDFFPETGGENGSLIQSGVEGSRASAVQRSGRHPSDSEWLASLVGGNGRDESTVEIV